ncbi:hypothetical protein P8452_64221 [Trifolium repens]|nr:hypothetical protein P8452_64221 [Trifolium repens]
MNRLPQDLVSKILTKLPAKELSKCKSICKSCEYYGFGFDPKSDDYKVVVLKDLWLKENDERENGFWNCELYSFNSNSWRKLDVEKLPMPFDIYGSSRIYTFVKNCYHWWGFIDSNIGDVVLAFNMVDEMFRKIKVPKIEYLNRSSECFKTLVPFDESDTIGLIVYPVRGLEKWFDVWVMKDYWDEGSWIKLYSVGPVPMIYKLVGFYGSNRFLWKDSNERLVLYEAENDNIRYLQVYGKYDSIRAARYMESLVTLQRGNESGRRCFSCSLVPDPLLNPEE